MGVLRKLTVAAALVLGGLAVQATGASAMPMLDTGPAVIAHSEAGSGVQEAYWHRGHRHSWHRHVWRRRFWHRHWHRY